MPPRTFHIDIELEHGQLRERLRSEDDRQTMIQRLDNILSDPSTDPDLRKGVIQVLTDQLRNNDGHEPLIIRSGKRTGDDEERFVWHCEHAKIKVKVDKYRKTDRTPQKPGVDKLFKFNNGDEDFDVDSTDYDDKDKAIDQKFFKFTIKGKDKTKPDPNDLVLDPCIICER